MISRSNGRSGGRHSEPIDNLRTDGMIDRTSGNRSSHHGYLVNKSSSGHSKPTKSASTSVKCKTVYLEKNQYHIYTIRLAEVLEIT